MAKNRCIGKEGTLPWHLPEDLKHFRAVTMGHAIIMGRKTHESIGRALPGRQNIVLTRNPALTFDGCEVVEELETAIRIARDHGDDCPRIIGGAAVYEAALPHCTTLYMTEVHREADGDVFFPVLRSDQWVERSRRESSDGACSFVEMGRVAKPVSHTSSSTSQTCQLRHNSLIKMTEKSQTGPSNGSARSATNHGRHKGGTAGKPNPDWTTSDSEDLYQIRGWGEPFFGVNDAGHVEVRPDPKSNARIDLHELVKSLSERGLSMPLLIRFSDILHDRIRHLNQCFRKAIKEYNYPGSYQGVFPVKVNQQRHVIEEVVRYGQPFHYGLEAGSKPELLIALAAMEHSDGLLICNGYKDVQYLETALIAQRFGRRVFIVLERVEELDLVFEASDRLGIAPVLGIRSKLTAKGMGRWAESVGDGAKFGLSAAEVVDVVDRLEERKMLASLQLVHFHIGSQVSSIIPIKNAMREASRFYVELAKLGANMKYLDVGGGLAIDYDGSKTDFHASKNYTTQEYAYDVVAAIQEACEGAELPPPTLVSESGRAIAAHQAVLVFNVVGTNEMRYPEPVPPEPDSHGVIEELYDTYKGVVPKNLQESWHDATQAREEANSLYKFGYLTLRDRARAERLFLHCARKIAAQARRLKHIPEELEEVEQVLSLIYYCNFSLFQSAPDSWAIDQLFPIMPIHRLKEKPGFKARLADLTCDSDGIVDRFIDLEEEQTRLPVHTYEGEPYYMAMFLVGAYQEILGDLHNLFGDTHTVHVENGDDGWRVSHLVKGDTMNDVLRYVSYNPDEMTESVRRQAEEAVKEKRITLPQMKLLMEHYERSLRSYTYLSEENE